MMHRVALLAAAAFAASAQEAPELFSKAPPEVDAALRTRMTQFYEFHMTEKYRQAEQLVAEDTKDFFYSSRKPKYLGFEIVRIQYSDGFTRAKATVLCEQYIMMPGFANKPMKVPTPSTWKLEPDGQWYWYVDSSEMRKTPFGTVKPGPAPQGGVPAIPDASQMAFIFSQVKADPQQVTLEGAEPVRVKLTNGAKGAVSVAVLPNNLGLEAKLENSQLKAGESTALVLRKAKGAKAGTLRLQVEPTNQIISIVVTLDEPPRGGTPEIPDAAGQAIIASQVNADPPRVALKGTQPARVKLTNGAKDAVSVAILPNDLRLTAKLEDGQLKAGHSTVLVLRKAKGAKAGTLQLQVEPTSQVISIGVTFE